MTSLSSRTVGGFDVGEVVLEPLGVAGCAPVRRAGVDKERVSARNAGAGGACSHRCGSHHHCRPRELDADQFRAPALRQRVTVFAIGPCAGALSKRGRARPAVVAPRCFGLRSRLRAAGGDRGTALRCQHEHFGHGVRVKTGTVAGNRSPVRLFRSPVFTRSILNTTLSRSMKGAVVWLRGCCGFVEFVSSRAGRR